MVNYRLKKSSIGIITCLLVFMGVYFCVQAGYVTKSPTGVIYELDEKSGYSYSDATACTGNASYGAKSIGSVNLYGEDLEESTFRGTTAYGAYSDVTIGYNYDGSYQTGTKSEWNLVKDTSKKVDSYSLSSQIKKGVIIIQKSSDGYTWIDACDPVTNFFADNKNGNLSLYTAPVSELKQGMYYRMIVAYEMEKQTKSGSITNWDGDWERHQYVEVYEFYLCYEDNPVTIHDLITRSTLNSGNSTTNGFYVDKGGSTDRVTVSKNGGEDNEITDGQSFTESGSYTVTITSKLGKTFTYTIRISDGLNLESLSPNVYESADKAGYIFDTKITGNTSYGAKSYTTLSIGQSANYDLVSSTKNGVPSYGIAGDSIRIFLRLNYGDNLTNNGWKLSDDTWGGVDGELVNGVQTGTVGTGAIIIQKSSDGSTWENADSGRYASGLYTTSFASYYGAGQDVLVYTPKGEDVVNGLYLRVMYAYEVVDSTGKNVKNYVEEYRFYLCSSDLDAVTIHNASISNELNELLSEEDQITMDLYKRAETLLDGAYTTTGFEIDKTLNPKVTISVKRNGVSIGIPTDGIFTETGKYEITLKSDVGNTKTITIYVDTMSNAESLEYYFGDSFLTGKRIYSEGEYPMFEAMLTEYNIAGVDANHRNITGNITNTTTGTVIELTSSGLAKSGVITEAGHYVAQFTTNDSYDDELKSGDAKIFTFQFDIIAEGTAPGPIVNQRNLEEYAHSSMVDCCPIYYGLTYSSAASGYITRVYGNWDDAFTDAYNYEKNTVEDQGNGTYRYTGSFIIAQKDLYESNWDLTAATNYFAEQAIQPLYFDMSDKYYYTTLRDSLIDSTSNLRQLELSRSVFIFADGQREILSDIDVLPIINDKPCAYLADGITQVPSEEYLEFKFISDSYNCDSYSVVIIDSNGNEYPIDYMSSVGKQLSENGCATGIITIHEETIYGDSNEYNAVYFAEGDNTAELTFSYYVGSDVKELTVSQENDGETIIEADLFSITNFKDELDPHCLIKVFDGNKTYAYCGNDGVKDSWAVPGDYVITCTNRLGYSYSVNVHVNESDNLVISLTGEGTEELNSIITSLGEKNIRLPELEKYGYNLVGYMDDETGILYCGSIDVVENTGLLTLRAIWEPISVNLIFMDANHEEIERQEVIFGREYELLIPENIDGYTFEAWDWNGTHISEKIFVDVEEDIILYAIYKDSAGNELSVDEESNTQGGFVKTIIKVVAGIFVFILILCISFVLYARKCTVEKDKEKGAIAECDKEDTNLKKSSDLETEIVQSNEEVLEENSSEKVDEKV